MPVCYLICFERAYCAKSGKKTKTARHYLGTSKDLSARLRLHTAGRGARLIDVIQKEGIAWRIVRLWEGGRDLEIKLKKKSFKRLCPCCNAKVADQLYEPKA